MVPHELQAIVDDLAQRLDVPIVLEDDEHRMLAYSSQQGVIDKVRRDTILRREASGEVKDWFRQFGIQQACSPLRIPGHGDLGILGRLCVPVRFRGRLLGFLFLIDDDAGLGDSAVALVERASAHAGLLLYEEGLTRRLNVSVLSHLLTPDPDLRNAAAEQLAAQGMASAEAPHAVLYLPRPAAQAAAPWPRLISEALFEFDRKTGHCGLVHAARPDHGVALVRVASPDDDRAAADAAQDILATLSRLYSPALQGAGARVVCGIGDPQPHLAAAITSYRQARLAAMVSAAVPSVGDVARWQDLGAFRMLAHLPAHEDCQSCLDPRLLTLLGADGDLIETVEVYLDLGGDAKRTSERLHLHRATLYYRLDKAQRLTGADLHDGNDRLALHLSFKLARLIGRYPAAKPSG